MADYLIALDGTTFALSDRSGDISGGVHGLFARDARYLSRWQLQLAGKKPRLLTSHHVDHFSNLCFLSNASGSELPPNSVSLLRRRVVGRGMDEELELTNHTERALQFELRLDIDADFLDLFQVKSREFANPEDRVFSEEVAEAVDVQREAQETGLRLARSDGEYSGEVSIAADPAPDTVDEHGMTWMMELDGHQAARVNLEVSVTIQGSPLERTRRLPDFGHGIGAALGGPDGAGIPIPRLRTTWDKLYRAYRRTIDDLGALLIHDPQVGAGLVAAGLPWFMAVFGRDTLITSYQILPGGQPLAWGALQTLAALQADADDPNRDAQPGRIVHELRYGPVAVNGNHFPYYGSIDAPMLFLIVLHELYLWSGDEDNVRALRPAAEAALKWMAEYGDMDGDGFIEYQRRASKGLRNQSWKDSWDSMRFHDGKLARAPIAGCEIQGYAYDAYVRMAELARGPWQDEAMATRLEGQAKRLAERFNEVFWTDDRGGFYHLGLDHDKRPVDSMTSNMGHLLWSGIVPPERAAIVADQLLGAGLFSGWGIRTMSAEDGGYNPISYHCGTVWPHDNSIAVAGLHRYGFHDHANQVMTAMIDASQHFLDSRLPEVFAGYGRSIGPFPVEYPTASTPQAWAAASPLFMLRAALGAKPDPTTRSITIDPHLPSFVHYLGIFGCMAFGQLWDVVVAEGTGSVTESVEPAAKGAR